MVSDKDKKMTVQPCTKSRPEDDQAAKDKILNDPNKVKPFITIKKRNKSTPDEHYVNREELERCIKEYYETEDDHCSNYEKLGEMFLKIATGVASSSSFARYSWKQDMICEALIKMVKALKGKKFSFNYGSSPFSYFTQVAYWAFIACQKAEKKQHEIVRKYRTLKYQEMINENSDDSCLVYIRPEDSDVIFYND
jgi:hypothetical protein